jgi:hypothetical protein
MVLKYDPEKFEHYSKRKYKEFDVCQLESCGKKLNRFGPGKRNKYCSEAHFKKAKLIYKRLWELKNADKVAQWKHDYYIKRRNQKLVANHKEIPPEDKKTYIE